jgi:hypothetical protein
MDDVDLQGAGGSRKEEIVVRGAEEGNTLSSTRGIAQKQPEGCGDFDVVIASQALGTNDIRTSTTFQHIAETVMTTGRGRERERAAEEETRQSAVDTIGDLHCCCGRSDCVFLRHNCTVLESVEKDVHVAAKMGQVSVASRLLRRVVRPHPHCRCHLHVSVCFCWA